MPRRNCHNRVPQNDRRMAHREVRRTHNLPFPKAFGIRRPLEAHTSHLIVGRMFELQAEDDIPAGVSLRRGLHATLLPQRVFGQQALKGLVGGYNLRGMDTELKKKTNGSDAETIEADIKGVHVYKGKIINLLIESEELEEERENIAIVMTALGLKGLHRMRAENRLHVSLGNIRTGMTRTEQRHVVHTVEENVDEVFGMENALVFEGWDVYPNLSEWQR